MEMFAELMRRGEPHLREYDGSGSWVRPVFSLLVTLIIAGVVLYGIRTFARSHQTTPPPDPLTIAKTRFANGEISKSELADIIKELR